MVIFSHRGIGFGKENSLEAFTLAVKEGFSVEVDLRLKENNVVLTHNVLNRPGEPFEFSGLLKLIDSNPGALFALHIKENSRLLFNKVIDSTRSLRNCLLFVTDFAQKQFISNAVKKIGKERLVLYVTTKTLPLDLIDNVEYLWLDETRKKIYRSLKNYASFNKKLICCSPEIFIVDDIQNNLKRFKKIVYGNNLFGVCTDFVKGWVDGKTI